MAAPLPGRITLTTDFGQADGYVGAMKGVMLAIDRDLELVDIAHDIPAHDVVHGALALRAAVPAFSPATVHLAVVDPGVGTERAGLVIIAGSQILVGPDNGLLQLAADALGGVLRCYCIASHPFLPERLSATFHGRDVFAPTAAALATGKLAPFQVGPLHTPADLPLPRPEALEDGRVRATILAVDRFGNLVTNLDGARLRQLGPDPVCTLPDGTALPIVGTYADAAHGSPAALVNSVDLLEVALRDGHAARHLSLGPGDQVHVGSRPN